MITREMLFGPAFYKKSDFYGSKGTYNFRISRRENEAEGEEYLLTVWKGPDCFAVTAEEKVTSSFPFSEEGMRQILAKLNALK